MALSKARVKELISYFSKNDGPIRSSPKMKKVLQRAMSVQDLIDELLKVEDKSAHVMLYTYDKASPDGSMSFSAYPLLSATEARINGNGPTDVMLEACDEEIFEIFKREILDEE